MTHLVSMDMRCGHLESDGRARAAAGRIPALTEVTRSRIDFHEFIVNGTTGPCSQPWDLTPVEKSGCPVLRPVGGLDQVIVRRHRQPG